MNIETLIVVVTYNSKDFIINCINSVIDSGYKKWFLVVMDNNSRDLTVKTVEDLEKNSKGLGSGNFKLIKSNNNIGFAGAINHCIFDFLLKEKTGLARSVKYILMLNPDCILGKNTILSLIDVFKSDKEGKVGVAGGVIFEYGGSKIQNAGGMMDGNFITSHMRDTRDDLYPVDYVSGALFMTELPVFCSIGGFDTGYRPVYYEELDYCLRLRRIGKKPVITKKAIAQHFECASVKKFSPIFFKYYHKNRIRCMVLNIGIKAFFKVFIPKEARWLKKYFKKQFSSILLSYFLNFLFLIYNLTIRLKNIFLIKNYNKRQFI